MSLLLTLLLTLPESPPSMIALGAKPLPASQSRSIRGQGGGLGKAIDGMEATQRTADMLGIKTPLRLRRALADAKRLQRTLDGLRVPQGSPKSIESPILKLDVTVIQATVTGR